MSSATEASTKTSPWNHVQYPVDRYGEWRISVVNIPRTIPHQNPGAPPTQRCRDLGMHVTHLVRLTPDTCITLAHN